MKSFNIVSKAVPIISLTFASVVFAFIIFFTVPFNKSVEFTGGYLFEISVYDNQKFLDFSHANSTLSITKLSNDHYSIKAIKVSNIEFLTKSLEDFSTIKSNSIVAPSITSSLIKKSIYAIFFSVLSVFVYIFIRFNIYYGLGTVITILHDVILSTAFIKICNIEFGISTIAALLTIVGYSVNDTVIVYDKIRASLTSQCNFNERLNQAINTTLPRTIGTSLTTIFAIIPVVFLANGEIKDFCSIVVFGIIIGTISSIAVSSLFLTPFKQKILNLIKLREQL